MEDARLIDTDQMEGLDQSIRVKSRQNTTALARSGRFTSRDI